MGLGCSNVKSKFVYFFSLDIIRRLLNIAFPMLKFSYDDLVLFVDKSVSFIVDPFLLCKSNVTLPLNR